MRTGERLRLLTESVTDAADTLQVWVTGSQELDREALQIVVDALRQSVLFGSGLRNVRPLLTVAEYEDLCGEAACLSRGLYEIAGERWCRRHALDTALGSQVLRRPGNPPPRPRGGN